MAPLLGPSLPRTFDLGTDSSTDERHSPLPGRRPKARASRLTAPGHERTLWSSAGSRLDVRAGPTTTPAWRLPMHRFARPTLVAIILAGAALSAAGAGAGSGWSDDPERNSLVADRPDDQVQVKIGPTADGGCYLAWYDNAEGGYDPTLQRLDTAGREQWPHNGIRIADTHFSWTTDYALAVTAEDEAIVAFRDDRGEGEQITVTRVAPDGAVLWGESGLQVDRSPDFLGPPKVVSTVDDHVVVAWTRDNHIRLRRLDRAARAVWSRDVVFRDPTGAQQMLADLQATPDGGVIVSWVHTQSFLAPRHLYAQKLGRDGIPLWGPGEATSDVRQPLVVFDAGTLQYGNFPPFLADGQGGAVFAWYETDPLLQTRVQHVRADGSLRFPPNGLPAAVPEPALERVEPALAYDVASQDIYVFWREMPHSGPLAHAIVGQRIAGTSDGTRSWSPDGKTFEPPVAHEVTELNAAAVPDGVLLAYAEKLAEGDQRLWIRRLDAAGDSVWSAERVAVSTVPSAKSRLTMAISRAGFAVLGWQDSRAGSEDIFVQNVNADGSLGPTGLSPTPYQATPTATQPPTSEPAPTSAPSAEPSGTRWPQDGWLYLPALNPLGHPTG